MSEKLQLKDVLAAIDLDAKDLWDDLSAEQRKSVTFFTLNRFISAVKGSRDIKEHHVLVTNERFNKHFYTIVKHPKLMWQLACSCSHESKRIHFHEWIGTKQYKDKKIEFLMKLFPDMKLADVEAMSAITSTDEIKQYCRDLGWNKKQVNEIKF